MRKFGKLALWTVFFLLLPAAAMAQDGDGGGSWGYALGAGLAVGLAGLGCGIGQGLTAGNTTAGIARNPGAAGACSARMNGGCGSGLPRPPIRCIRPGPCPGMRNRRCRNFRP